MKYMIVFQDLLNTQLIKILNALLLTLGEKLEGVGSEAAAQKLRGRAGTSVTITVQSVILNSFCLLPAEITKPSF